MPTPSDATVDPSVPTEDPAWRELLAEPAERFERRIGKAKRLIYPRRTAEDWRKASFASDTALAAQLEAIPDNGPRIDTREVSREEFVRDWEQPRRPVVIRGATESWAAGAAGDRQGRGGAWSLGELLRQYGGERFKVGEDDDSYAVWLKLKYYLRYLATSRDDSPLYVFDSSFAERSGTSRLGRDYAPPHYFADDLFRYAGERRRPPYRWFVLGPARSGSYVHIDPLGTSAWNALLQGRKLWALLPPHVPKEVVQPTPKLHGGREAVAWWANVYPKLAAATDPDHRPLTLVQTAGETVYVPGGWWHCVLNLDVTPPQLTQSLVPRE